MGKEWCFVPKHGVNKLLTLLISIQTFIKVEKNDQVLSKQFSLDSLYFNNLYLQSNDHLSRVSKIVYHPKRHLSILSKAHLGRGQKTVQKCF